jgi:hypothetical protein
MARPLIVASGDLCQREWTTVRISHRARLATGHPLRLTSNNPPTTAARIMLALSASTRITSSGMPNSSCAMLPVSIAAIAAVANAMTRKATLNVSHRA